MTYPRIPLLSTFFVLWLAGCTPTPENQDADVMDLSVGDASLIDTEDANIPECSSDPECNDRSSCTRDSCQDGRCVHERIAAEVELENLMAMPDGVVHMEYVGDLMLVARGALGSQVWNVQEVPPRKMLDYEPRDDEAPHTGLHAFDGGVVARSGRWMYPLDSSGARVGEYRASDDIQDILPFEDGSVILALYAKGIEIVDLGSGIFPTRVGRTDTLGRAVDLSRVDDLLFVADGLLGVSIVDVSEPDGPVLWEQNVATAGRVDKLSAAGDRITLLEAGAGWGTLQVTDEGIERVSQTPLMPKVLDVHMIDPATVALVTESNGIQLFGVSEAAQPTEWIQIEIEGRILGFAGVGREFLVHREDGRVVKATLSCGEEDGPPIAESPPSSDAGAPEGQADAFID